MFRAVSLPGVSVSPCVQNPPDGVIQHFLGYRLFQERPHPGLQSLGLILLVSTKVGRAYTNRIRLLFAPETFLSIWQKRFG